jgi:MGT family glycosyltransferase
LKIVAYTSPGRGHLYPTVPMLLELTRRGHDVLLVTLRDEAARIAATGVRTKAMAPAIESLQHDDYGAASPIGALGRAVRTMAARAALEIPDLEATIAAEQPDLLLIDFNCWGAAALAEKSGLPWASFMPYFLPWRLAGLPPFGPGLAPRHDALGRMRDWLAGTLLDTMLDRNLPLVNETRQRLGLPPLAHMTELGRSAPLVLYYTAEPFEYPSAARPANVVMVGPMAWEPPSPAPDWLARVDKPLVLVTCSTEYQDDGRLAAAALDALADRDVFVVVTTGAVDPAGLRVPANARVERFLSHTPLLARAACVICHGGMGITQKALAAGVPVCVVPFGRDQLEVARHVEVAEAGVRLSPSRLTPARLRDAVQRARERKAGAERIASAFRKAGGATRAADELERLTASARPASALASRYTSLPASSNAPTP